MSDFLHTGNDAEQRLWVKQDRWWPLILGELRITEQNDHSRDCGKSSVKAAVHSVSTWSDMQMSENAKQDGAETFEHKLATKMLNKNRYSSSETGSSSQRSKGEFVPQLFKISGEQVG